MQWSSTIQVIAQMLLDGTLAITGLSSTPWAVFWFLNMASAKPMTYKTMTYKVMPYNILTYIKQMLMKRWPKNNDLSKNDTRQRPTYKTVTNKKWLIYIDWWPKNMLSSWSVIKIFYLCFKIEVILIDLQLYTNSYTLIDYIIFL